MKVIHLIFVCLLVQFHESFAQEVSNALDVEFDTYCMMDSIAPGNEVEFVRLYYYNRDEFKDLSADMNSAYTVQGTALPCWQLTGTKECYLMNHTVSNLLFSYGLDNGQRENYNSDYFLVALRLREHLDLNLYNRRQSYVIPLNYPYGNTASEVVRLQQDLSDYFECKGICAYIQTVTQGSFSISLSVQIMWYQMGVATYSSNPASPNPTYIDDNPFLSVLGNASCSRVHDVYRKEKNGAILYYVDPDGVVNAPPLPAVREMVSCDYETERLTHCDRPTGGQECWASTLEDEICSFTIIIADSIGLDSLWINGDQVLTQTYCPFEPLGPPTCPGHNALKDSIQAYYDSNNMWGEVSVNNTVNAEPGWIFSVNYSDQPIDSIRDENGNIFYPIVEDCRTFSYYSVHRNELGGVVSCLDQYGHNMYCPPESARRVSCESAEGKAGCRVQGYWGTEMVDGESKTFDISKYWSFSYVVKDTPVVIRTLTFSGDTTEFECPIGFSEKFTSGDECKLIKSNFLQFDASAGGKVKISYGW